jgi:hypothetical protein
MEDDKQKMPPFMGGCAVLIKVLLQKPLLLLRCQPAFVANGVLEPDDIDDEVDDVHGRLGIFTDAEIAHHEIAIAHDPYDVAELEAQRCVIIGPEKCRKDDYPADVRIEEPTKIRVEAIIHDG